MRNSFQARIETNATTSVTLGERVTNTEFQFFKEFVACPSAIEKETLIVIRSGERDKNFYLQLANISR